MYNPEFDEDVAMVEEQEQCCCGEKSIDINDWETSHSLQYNYDERNEIDDPMMIEFFEKEKLFDFSKEPEVRLKFDDLFCLDINEFYPFADINIDEEFMESFPPI